MFENQENECSKIAQLMVKIIDILCETNMF